MSAGLLKYLVALLVLACLLGACTEEVPDYVRQAFPEAASVERVKGRHPHSLAAVWRVLDGERALLGYSALAEGQGFNGPVEVAVGWVPGWGISHVQVVHQEESPDYGGKHLHSAWFTEQFLGNPEGREYNLVKMRRQEPQDVVVITGATASSQAVLSAVNQCLAVFKELSPEEE
ncbi:MAG: FMN-binding protein [Bacillota bacterium]|jgi:Na+-translocating ferredoxin:NAD+ oxidoreductase RnfG subunit